MSFKNKKAIMERKNDLITRAETIVNTAELEKRELTEDEAMELAEIRDDVKKIKHMLETMADIDDMREMQPKPDADPAPEEARECNPDQKRAADEEAAFEAFIRGQVLNGRATNLTETAGGALIPTTVARRIIEEVYDVCPILAKSTKYNVKGDLVIPTYASSASGVTVAFASEFTDLEASIGTFGSVTLKDFLAGALSLISRSLINNTEINLTDFVVKRMAADIARFMEGAILKGQQNIGGTDDDFIGLSDAVVGKTAAAATAVTADELIQFKDSVKDAYQKNAMWIMSPATRTAIRLLKDEYGRYLLNDDLNSEFGSKLLGKDVYVSDNMPDMATGVNAIYFGDPAALATKFTEDMNIQILREKYATMHAIGVVGWVDFDARIENKQAIKALKMA